MSSGKPSGFVVFRTFVLSCLSLEPHVTGPKSVNHDFPHLIMIMIMTDQVFMVAEKGGLWSHTVCESRTVRMNYSC